MALVEIQTNTSVFCTIPHISWTAFEDTSGTIQKRSFANEFIYMRIKMNYKETLH